MSLSFAVIVFFGVTVRLHDQVLVAAIWGWWRAKPCTSHVCPPTPPTRCVARAETCQLACHLATVLTGQQCRGVTLHGLWTKYIIYIWNLSALHYCKRRKKKKDTGVSSRYSYINFLYLLFCTRELVWILWYFVMVSLSLFSFFLTA